MKTLSIGLLALALGGAALALPPRNELDELRHTRELRQAAARRDARGVQRARHLLRRDHLQTTRDANDNFPYGNPYYGSASNLRGLHSRRRKRLSP